MKPRLVKRFNQGQENYFKFEVDTGAYEPEESLRRFLKSLGFDRPFYKILGKDSDEKFFLKKSYQQRIGLHNFLENKEFKIHVIFSEDHLNLIVKCSSKNRMLLNKKLIEFFEVLA